MVFGRNPEKLEAKALDYERRGKTAKALKYREKAARLRAGTAAPLTGAPLTGAPLMGAPLTGAPLTGAPLTGAPLAAAPASGNLFTSFRSPQRYEQNALKWEQRGNWTKAQKNREKVWRLQNPQYGSSYAAPQFYNNNRFLGYNAPLAGAAPLSKAPLVQGAAIHHTLPAVVETHVRPTVIEQTMRPERIVEVQPVVHREVVAPEVHVVEKHLYEQVRSTGPSVINKAPIVEETVRPRIIEEIQPVVHREVPAPFVERVEQHVTEHITKPTTMTKEVINDATVRPAGMAAGGPGLVQQTTTTTTATTVPGQGPLAGVKNAIHNATHRA